MAITKAHHLESKNIKKSKTDIGSYCDLEIFLIVKLIEFFVVMQPL